MNEIKIKMGKSISLLEKPIDFQSFTLKSEIYGLDLCDFFHLPIRSKVEINQKVLRGEILAFHKNFKSICFFSPVSGSVRNIIFNEKHRLKQIIID